MMMGFAAVILLGTILLCLPISSADGKSVCWLDALFTATTSVCVTGLVTVPTATTWSTFGKIVVLGLIQFGGLGIMACLTMFLLILRRKISLQSRKLIQATYNLPVLKGSVGIVRKLLIGTAVVEFAGAVLYSFWFVPKYGLFKGIGYSIFHSISAFCNAGIDLVGESSFAPFVTNPLINFTTMGLILLSGLGFPVWWEVIERIQDLIKGKRTRKNFVRGFTLHTKLVLTTTVILLFGGALLILALDWNHASSLGGLKPAQKVMAAFFQSVTTRTAGFETIPQADFSDGSAMVSMILMFIGGSPMGTAGGVKTTTVAILLVLVASYIRGDSDTVVWGRKVMDENIRTAIVIFFFALTMAFTATVLLVSVTGSPLLDCAYEIISAVATVGLTRSLTSTLAQAGKEVLAVDKDVELVQEIADLVTYAARADITDSRVFASLGISNMDVVIVGIAENMEASILATLQAKEAGVPLVIAKGMSQMHANILKKVGADRVVMAESETGVRLGKNLISGGFQDFFMLSDSFSMVELPVPDAWTGHNLEELDLRKKYGINVIAVKNDTDIRVSVNPKAALQSDEVLILVGENKELAKLMKNRK